MRKSSLLLIALFVALIVSTGCREERKIDVAAKLNPKTMATMTTKNVATFISDSGVVQYKIVAPIWKVYDEVDTPYWSFPQGLYLQKYDRSFQVIATVAADSARFFSQEKVWRLDGHVEMTKVPKDLFQTEQLYWDQRRRILYSDSFIHIETSTHTLEGIGFESDERLTSYRIIKPQGIFPVNSQDFAAGGAPSTAPSPVASPVTAAPGAPPQSSPIISNNSTP
ncbi:MAG: LPS export ABC transporter periplasmic protein LptC [Muribaculaceae bacterium]|nr:LPS export ABC transporter periplasmic protein LptC [Bacteroidales bacterium]MDD6942684.1 LPS export ABC transporter periplasmic protein LptC [Bacteroidales bacterium]MDY2733201.1 LPS export ABC transporter periplasmic protein LptC [Muribaculaceae bacterium]